MAVDADGVIRVSGTRVTLDTVIEAFNEGVPADEIARQYPVLPPADVYHLIGYYLRHKAEVDGYLRKGREEAEGLCRQIEARRPPQGIRKRLLARKNRRKKKVA